MGLQSRIGKLFIREELYIKKLKNHFKVSVDLHSF